MNAVIATLLIRKFTSNPLKFKLFRKDDNCLLRDIFDAAIIYRLICSIVPRNEVGYLALFTSERRIISFLFLMLCSLLYIVGFLEIVCRQRVSYDPASKNRSFTSEDHGNKEGGRNIHNLRRARIQGRILRTRSGQDLPLVRFQKREKIHRMEKVISAY